MNIYSVLAVLLLPLALDTVPQSAHAAQTIVANYTGASLYIVDLTTGDRTVLSSSTVGTGPAFDQPVSAAISSNGVLYIGTNSQIIKVDVATGNRSLLANPGAVSYNGIYGLAFDTQGNLIAGSEIDSAIYKIDPATGVRTTLASSSVGSGTAVGGPGGLLVDGDGSIVYTDFRNSSVWRLVRLDPTTLVRTAISYPNNAPPVGTGPTTGQSGTVVKLADGSFAVSNYNGATTQWITRVDPDTGNRTILSGSATGTGPAIGAVFALSTASDGSLFASDFSKNALLKIVPATGDRTVISLLGTAGTGPAFARPLGILAAAVASVTQPPPVITSSTTFAGDYASSSFSYIITSTNSPTSFDATGLPTGLSINHASGEISGAATQAGTFTVNLSAINAGGTGTATLTLTITVLIAPQTITFSAPPDRHTTDGPFPVVATADSGLPVTFIVDGGPASVLGNIVTLSSAPGTVSIRASQAGDATHAAASDVTQSFIVAPIGPQVYFGETADHDTLAANISQDDTHGTIIGDLAGTNQGFVLDFTLNSDGTFHGLASVFASQQTAAQTPAALAPQVGAGTLTLTGTVINGVMSGMIVESNLAFTANVQPQIGPTSAIAGYYTASATNTAMGSTYSVIGTAGHIYVLAVTPDLVTAGNGTADISGSFAVAISATTALSGRVDPATTIITSALASAGVSVDFNGVNVTTPRSDRLINLSARGNVSPAQPLIAGFVIGGSIPKRVLLRGIGPALAQFGLNHVLTDPTIRLFNRQGQIVFENDNWTGSDVALAMTQVGAFSLAAESKDAALLVTLDPGTYTMHVSSNDGTSGVALAEVYDASATPETDYQRLINVSSRATVGAGENILIDGFVVTGNAPKQLLIRGSGPSLAQFGVSSVLPDPVIRVVDRNDVTIARNDDWSTPVVVAIGQSVASAVDIVAADTATGAFPFDPASKDAALIVTLNPGVYTVLLNDNANIGGNALIEIYEIP